MFCGRHEWMPHSVLQVGNLKIREIPFYCLFGTKCLLRSLTLYILALGFVLKVQGDYVCGLVSAGAKNNGRDFIFEFVNIFNFEY